MIKSIEVSIFFISVNLQIHQARLLSIFFFSEIECRGQNSCPQNMKCIKGQCQCLAPYVLEGQQCKRKFLSVNHRFIMLFAIYFYFLRIGNLLPRYYNYMLVTLVTFRQQSSHIGYYL